MLELIQTEAALRARGAVQYPVPLGLWASSCSTQVTELLAHSGLDWLCVDMEHAPNELPDVLAHLQCSRARACEHGVMARRGWCAVHARWCAVRAHPLAEHPVREAALRLAHVRFTADARHQARPRVAAGAQQLLQAGLG